VSEDPDDLVFTGPGGGVVTRGARTVLSRHNFRRTYHNALAKLADPATELRPTAARVLKALRADGPQTAAELVVTLARQGRAIRPATIHTALGELATAGLAAADGGGQDRRWSPLAPAGDPLLDAVDLRGAHDFRHTFATWLEDAGIPARVIDELMGHEATSRGAQQLGSAMGAHYRHHPGDGRSSGHSDPGAACGRGPHRRGGLGSQPEPSATSRVLTTAHGGFSGKSLANGGSRPTGHATGRALDPA
jgi:hypothetical protein